MVLYRSCYGTVFELYFDNAFTLCFLYKCLVYLCSCVYFNKVRANCYEQRKSSFVCFLIVKVIPQISVWRLHVSSSHGFVVNRCTSRCIVVYIIKMVLIHVKNGDDSQFLYEASLETPVDECTLNITSIYNGRLKISRICSEMEELKKYGTLLPPEIMGLTDEQVVELKLVDTWGEKCIPSGGYTFHKDPIGRRNGKRPNEQMQNVLTKTIEEAKACVSKKLVQSQISLTQKKVQEALDLLRGAIMIVYPMNLPPHDNIRLEIENNEDLSGTHASLEVIAPNIAQLWFSGRELVREPNKKMKDYLGRNEKTKVVLKLTKTGAGPPAREPPLSEQDRKLLMAEAFKKQEELKVS